MENACPTTTQGPPETVGSSPPEGGYYVIREGMVIGGFGSFHEAYMHALNRFCSEDFLVWKEGW